ncbi:hypothetical protein Sste5346_003249 [Sporothrix stenoceras]|uniref:CCHC-type domain-containing protein n=1 Tax=Sporothrix stenoceras TaxID=5173 RepID=A0ABR3ZEQ0_9PEZI
MAAQQEPALTASSGRSRMERYFPAVTKDAVFCIGCASVGHIFEACPLRTCKLCGGSSDEHLLFGCPTVDLSELSKPTAIVAEDGTPKLTGTETAPKCPICQEDVTHFVACPLLWRTFVRNPTNKRSAAEISTACYFCGQDDHFGGDCKDNTGEHLSGRRYERQDDVWNRKYVLQFSDLTKTTPFTGVVTTEKRAVPSVTVLVVRESKRQKKANTNGSDASKTEQKKGSQQTGHAGGNAKANPSSNAAANVAQEQGKGKRKKKGKGKAGGEQPQPPAQAKEAGDQNPTPLRVDTNPPKQAKAKGKGKGKGKGKQAAEQQGPTPTPATEPATASTVPTSVPAPNPTGTSAVAQAPSAEDTPAPAPGKPGRKKHARSASQAQDQASAQGPSGTQLQTDDNAGGNAQGGSKSDAPEI